MSIIDVERSDPIETAIRVLATSAAQLLKLDDEIASFLSKLESQMQARMRPLARCEVRLQPHRANGRQLVHAGSRIAWELDGGHWRIIFRGRPRDWPLGGCSRDLRAHIAGSPALRELVEAVVDDHPDGQ